MPEAEVSLRLAMSLCERNLAAGRLSVAIDGAQVRTGKRVHFALAEFMTHKGWALETSAAEWRGVYLADSGHEIEIHSRPGQGDVIAELKSGKTLRAEAKKGPLTRSKSSQEYPLMREALGQLMTLEEIAPDDILAIAIPSSEKFESLARDWRSRPLIQSSGINIATVSREGTIRGLEAFGI